MKTIDGIARDRDGRPFVAALSTEDSRPLIDGFFKLGLEECRSLHEQGWQRCGELGYVGTPVAEEGHGAP